MCAQSQGAITAVDIWEYSQWPEGDAGNNAMEFHLVYQGRLPAAGQSSTRSREKQDIRKVFHRQMASLWSTHPFLAGFGHENDDDRSEYKTFGLANRYQRCGYRFLPLVSEWFSAACSLDILFLRRDGPGSLIRSGGDIDNRLKVLFDALRMPQTCDEVCGDKPAPDEDPFFVLLEDDRLISRVSVETNWLLEPPRDGEHINDVHLVIKAKTLLSEARKYETAFH